MKLDWTKVGKAERFLAAMQIIHACQKCGSCCVHMSGIAFNSVDTIRMAKQLGIGRNEFVKQYTVPSETKATDRWLKCKGDAECIFWSATGCTQYLGRGQVCRLYPFTAPEQLGAVRRGAPWGMYPKCQGMRETYKRVLEESFKMDAAVAKSIVDSDIGKICYLNTVRDMYEEDTADFAAKEFGLEKLPPMDRLKTLALGYAVAYQAVTFSKEHRERQLAELAMEDNECPQ